MYIHTRSRQVPRDPKILQQKQYHDILYCHLQAISILFKDEIIEYRIVPKERMKYIDLARAVGLTRQTISNRIKNLEAIGLISFDKNGDCIITDLMPKQAFLLPIETVKYLVSVYNDHTIDTYIYLINRYYANGEKPFIFSIDALKANCGLSIKSSGNNYIINNILDTLVKSKLIKISKRMQTINKKTHRFEILHKLEWATNEYIPESTDTELE